uniref:Putative DNA binding, helix-turn-helix domain containing protein n=2 Tax=viral metagenome TaxID=1070528 RepID=A0A6M3LCU7_9ZZZZ
MAKELMDVTEAAEFLRLSRVTLDIWRSAKTGPPFIRAGRRILYRLDDLREWVAARQVTPERVN